MTEEILQLIMERDATMTEAALKGYYTEDADLAVLLDAERYSLFAGGKRIRPLLTLEFYLLLGIFQGGIAKTDQSHALLI